MALDLEEQENLANLKSFWARYGNYIIGVITVALLVYSGMSAWKWYQRDQAADAGKLYETLINSISKNEKDKTYLAAEDLQKKYGGTSYAAMGSLVAAKVAMDSNDATKAQSYLKWTANQASALIFTDSAAAKVADLIAEEGNPELKLRVFVQGGGCSGFQYGFTFDDAVNEDDTSFEKNGVTLLVDSMSFQYLVGAEIDYKEDINGSQFVIKNPNATTTCGCGSSFSA